jgi:hypothetical protein
VTVAVTLGSILLSPTRIHHMTFRFNTFVGAAAVALMASVAGAQNRTVTCTDGTTSTAVGRGACSGHGGVKKMDKKAAKKAVKKAEKKADEAAKKAEKVEDKAEKKAEKTVSKGVGAQVTCTDGTMSKPGRGACSRHGGIKKG